MSETALLREFSRTLLSQQFEQRSDGELLEQFRLSRDADAFAALLRRHAGLVRGVCRRVLHDPHLADDVFQATFLLLARKAASLRQSELVANWLFGVARRLSLKALIKRERAAKHERLAASSKLEVQATQPWDDLLRLLDEELERLPGCYRRPLMACYLRDMTQDETASQLGLSVRTLRRRLAKGRELLRQRLAARGAGLSVVLGASVAGSGKVEASLIDAAMAAIVSNSITPEVAGLAATTMQFTTAVKIRIGMFAVLALSVLVGVLASPMMPQAPGDQPPPKPKPLPEIAARRDRYNDPLPPGALLRLGTISLQHAAQVDRLGFSPDGKELFSCGHDLLRRWQIETGHEIAHFDFRDAGREVVDYALTPDWKNAIVVYGNPDHSLGPHAVEMYDVSSKQRIQEFSIPHRQSIALDTSGRVLTANSSKIEIWDIKTARVTSSIPFKKKNSSLLLKASGDTLIAIDGAYDIHVFDIKREIELRSFGRGTSGSIWACWLSQNGKWFVTKGYSLGEMKPAGKNLGMQQMIPDSFLRVWDVEKGDTVGMIQSVTGVYPNVSFSPDGQTAIVASMNEKGSCAVEWWDISTRHQKTTWPDELPPSSITALSPDQKTLAVASNSGCIHLWDVTTRQSIHHFESHEGSICKAAFSADGKSVRTIGYDDAIIEWDARSGGQIRRRHEPAKPQGMYTYSSDGRFRAVADRSPEGRLAVWDLEKDCLARDLGPCQLSIHTLSLSADGSHLAVAMIENQKAWLQCWNVRTGEALAPINVDSDRNGSPNVRFLKNCLFMTWLGRVIGFDALTGRELFRWNVADFGSVSSEDARLSTIVPFREGHWLACALPNNGAIQIRELETGKVLRQLPHGYAHYPISFSPDGRRLATATDGSSPTIDVWDVTDGTLLKEFTGHRGRMICLEFSPDGKKLLSGGGDCTALVWQIEP